MQAPTDMAVPEWPLAIAANRVASEPLELVVEAPLPVREALARRFDILAIQALAAEVTLWRLADGDIAVSARLRASLTQACVVTLEPVDEVIDVGLEGSFTERPETQSGGDVIVDPDDGADEPEPIVDGHLQLGEWLSQNLSLAMEPFPRAAGAALDGFDRDGPANDEGKVHPLAGLAGMRGPRDTGDDDDHS